MQPNAALTTVGLMFDFVGAVLLVFPLLTTRERVTRDGLAVKERMIELQRLMREERLSFEEANLRSSGKVERKVRDAKIGAVGAILMAAGFGLQILSQWI